jgi:tight adherence protein C
MISDVERRARKRLGVIKERLPYVVDLIALMMEAGAGFMESLKTAATENRNHPLGQELALVVRDTDLGATRREALGNLRDRLDDPDFSDLLLAIIRGEELGTPLAEIMRTQADQLRLKQSQWQEKQSAEAQVAIIFPGLVVMAACILIIMAPFLLKIFGESGGLSALFS